MHNVFAYIFPPDRSSCAHKFAPESLTLIGILNGKHHYATNEQLRVRTVGRLARIDYEPADCRSV